MRPFRWVLYISAVLMSIGIIWIQLLPKAERRPGESEAWGEIYDRIGQVYYRTDDDSGWSVARKTKLLSSSRFDLESQDKSHLFLHFARKVGKLILGESSEIKILFNRATPSGPRCRIEIFSGEFFLNLFGTQDVNCAVFWRGNEVATMKNGAANFRVRGNSLIVNNHRGVVKLAGKEKLLEKYMWARVSSDGVRYFFDQLVVLTPFPNETVYQGIKSKAPTRFAWTKLEDNSKVQLYIGKSRSNLRPAWKKAIPAKKREGFFKFAPGNYYWQIRSAKKGKVKSSPIYKLFIQEETAPVLTFPIAATPIFVDSSSDYPFRFLWMNPSRLERLLLEISESRDFKNTVLSHTVRDFGFYSTSLQLEDGIYFWRLSGFRHDSSEQLSSRPQKFRVIHKKTSFQKLSSWPSDGERFGRFELLAKEGHLLWKAFRGFENVRLRISDAAGRRPEIWELSVDQNRFTLPSLPEGEYNWNIQGLMDSKWIDITSRKQFVVENIPRLNLKTVSGSKKVSWSRGPRDTASYEVIIKPIRFDPEGIHDLEILSSRTRKTEYTLAKKMKDLVAMKIIAFDKKGNILAKSEEKILRTGQ